MTICISGKEPCESLIHHCYVVGIQRRYGPVPGTAFFMFALTTDVTLSGNAIIPRPRKGLEEHITKSNHTWLSNGITVGLTDINRIVFDLRTKGWIGQLPWRGKSKGIANQLVPGLQAGNPINTQATIPLEVLHCSSCGRTKNAINDQV